MKQYKNRTKNFWRKKGKVYFFLLLNLLLTWPHLQHSSEQVKCTWSSIPPLCAPMVMLIKQIFCSLQDCRIHEQKRIDVWPKEANTDQPTACCLQNFKLYDQERQQLFRQHPLFSTSKGDNSCSENILCSLWVRETTAVQTSSVFYQ